MLTISDVLVQDALSDPRDPLGVASLHAVSHSLTIPLLSDQYLGPRLAHRNKLIVKPMPSAHRDHVLHHVGTLDLIRPRPRSTLHIHPLVFALVSPCRLLQVDSRDNLPHPRPANLAAGGEVVDRDPPKRRVRQQTVGVGKQEVVTQSELLRARFWSLNDLDLIKEVGQMGDQPGRERVGLLERAGDLAQDERRLNRVGGEGGVDWMVFGDQRERFTAAGRGANKSVIPAGCGLRSGLQLVAFLAYGKSSLRPAGLTQTPHAPNASLQSSVTSNTLASFPSISSNKPLNPIAQSSAWSGPSSRSSWPSSSSARREAALAFTLHEESVDRKRDSAANFVERGNDSSWSMAIVARCWSVEEG